MGGTGSGRWTRHDKKTTVEECWAIGISEVVGVVDFSKPGPASGYLRPRRPKSGEQMVAVCCAFEPDLEGAVLLTLSYVHKNKRGQECRTEQVVPLQTTRPNFGGARWWFSCPRMVNGKQCGRRVGNLYRDPYSRRFACRHCLDLTYESCQKSHRLDGLFALVAGEASGEVFEAVKRAFSYQSKEARRRSAGPSPNLLDAFEAVFGEAKDR